MTLLPNLAAYSAQLLILIAIGLVLPSLLRLTAPHVRHAYWRGLLLACLLLPWMQGRQLVADDVTTAAIVVGAATVADGMARLPLPLWNWTAIAAALLLAGAVARLSWMALGLVRLWSLRASGYVAPARADHEEAQRNLQTRAELRYVRGLTQPVTFGLRRPVVLLPEDLAAAPPEIERAVLHHELLHVQRRDWGWLLFEEVVRSLFWFHPAMWLLVSRIQQSREEVVDELAVMATGARRTYIEALARFAGASDTTAAPAFARRQMLYRRILLLSRDGSMSSRRVVFSCALVLAVLLGGRMSAVSAFPLQQQSDGTPADVAPMSIVDVMLPEMPRTSPAQTGSRSTMPRARRAPALTEPASREIGNAVEETAADPQTPPESIAAPAAADGMPEAADERPPLRVGSTIGAPKKLRDVKPVYPPIAMSAQVQGIVVMEAVVDSLGRVRDARVLRSIPLLDAAALDAVRQWSFEPTLLNGVPVPIVMTLTVNFVLDR